MTFIEKFSFAVRDFFGGFLHKLNEPVRFNSLRFEISLLFTGILAIILVAFSGVVYYVLSETLYAELDNEVEAKAWEVAENIRTFVDTRTEMENALQFAAEKTIANADSVQRRWWYLGFERDWFKRLDRQDLSNSFVNLVSPAGKVVARSKNIPEEFLDSMVANRGLLDRTTSRFFYLENGEQTIRVVNYPFISHDGAVYVLQVGISPRPVVLILENWLRQMLIIVPVILVLTGFIGNLLAGRILRPIQRITQAANSISYEDFSRRVEAQKVYPEMTSLITSFNDMISRLEKSFSHIESFSSHLAHEIKTPLTIMRGETELALIQKRDPKEYQDTLQINLEEITKMLKIVDDLLFLTKMDYQPECFQFEEVNVYEYCLEIYESSQILALEKDVTLHFNFPSGAEDVQISADKVHLRRLFFNLIDNAIKFTPKDGEIYLSVKITADAVNFAIEDTGSGIAAENIERIFDRFYRVDNRFAGSGLGLSIAYSIARAHGGSIDVHSQVSEGTVFTVSLPRVKSRRRQKLIKT